MPISVLQPAWLFPHSDACGDAERGEHGNDGRTAVGEERQRQAHDRQQTDIHKDIHERLKTILDTLPEKQKEVVLLHIVEKKKIKEIATQMDIAETTVKTHFKRAMAILRNNLKLVLFGV